METTINILGKSQINIIRQLLRHQGKVNDQPVLYKKTANAFRRTYGVGLELAPIIFVANESIYKLSHFTYKSRGRIFETASYLPIVRCGNYFKRLERKDILINNL